MNHEQAQPGVISSAELVADREAAHEPRKELGLVGAGGVRAPRSEEWKRKQSEGVKRAYAEGKMNHVRDPEFIARRSAIMRVKLKGRKASLETREKIRLAHLGKKLSPERIKAMRNRKLSDNEKTKCRENMLKCRERLKDPDVHKRRIAASAKARTGNHGYGRQARGRQDHDKAKYWVVRDPVGVIHEFSNAMEWCRTNVHLFHDYYPDAKTPLWKRAFGGFSAMGQTDGGLCSWNGWVLLSVRELNTGAADLLGRDEAELELRAGGGGAEQAGDSAATQRSRAGSATDPKLRDCEGVARAVPNAPHEGDANK